MSVLFNPQSANERRRNAEVSFKDILLYRKGVVSVGDAGARQAIIIKFPNLLLPKTDLSVESSDVSPKVAPVSQPLADVINLADRFSTQELIERDHRIASAQQSIEEVHLEASA